jgi:peptide-methionine (R)-S-oxide reductase
VFFIFDENRANLEGGTCRLVNVFERDRSSIMEMHRRTFVLGAVAALLLAGRRGRTEEKSTPGIQPISRSPEEWRKILTPEQFAVLREEATEPPGSSPLDHEKREGTFVCAGCELALFTSKMKFDSGTGWPSFFTAIPGHLGTKRDVALMMPRTEYHCIRCGGHQGHVFDDGPPPTGQRWCNNGVALKFVPGKIS